MVQNMQAIELYRTVHYARWYEKHGEVEDKNSLKLDGVAMRPACNIPAQDGWCRSNEWVTSSCRGSTYTYDSRAKTNTHFSKERLGVLQI